ncbi:MAG: histidine kinase dimerization/phospho-acceptor domain-containing protein, partial [Bacteroidota bacterium]
MNRLLKRQLKRSQVNFESLSPEVKRLLLSVSDSYDHHHKNLQLIERTMDISSLELNQANKELRKNQEELTRSNNELKRFAYITAHDLKEPLRTIASFIQLIHRREKNLQPESREFIQYVISGVQNMRSLLDDLMEYSMIEGGAIQYEHQQLSLEEILLQVRWNLNSKIQEFEADIQCTQLPKIKAEKTQMIQLFQNMIDNSIKFRSSEKPIIKILSQPANQAGFVTISVIDNGIGIPEEYQELVFQIFQRLHSKE